MGSSTGLLSIRRTAARAGSGRGTTAIVVDGERKNASGQASTTSTRSRQIADTASWAAMMLSG